MKQQTNRNRRWVLASRPHGAPQMDNFRLEEDDVATPGEGRCYCVPFFYHSTLICVAA